MLERLFGLQRPWGQQACTLNIIVIPALGLSRPKEWLDPSDPSGHPWLQKLVDDVAPNADVWEYVYSEARHSSLADGLTREGNNLLLSLYKNCTSGDSKNTQQQPKQPLFFICHGTGGLVLKIALCICRDQPFQYRPVIDVVGGAVFLSSPHFSGGKHEAKKTIDLLLRCQHKGFGGTVSRDDDTDALIEVCKSFERLTLKVPVVSVYETKETSTSRSIFSKLRSKGRNQVVIPKTLGTLRLGPPQETSVEGEADHFNACHVRSDSPLYEKLQARLRDVLRDAPSRIAEASQPYTVPSGLKDDTLRSPSTAGHTLLDERTSLPISSPFGGATGGSTTGSFEFVPREAPVEENGIDPALPCFWMGTRRRLDHFFGRDDVMQSIDQVLLPPLIGTSLESNDRGDGTESQLRSFAICGLGGMGKTELAVEYAYSRRDKFEAIFWLGADDAKILASNFAQIAQRLGLEDEPSDFAASRDIVMGWLSLPLKKAAEAHTPENMADWLIIFDNVDNLDVLSDYWPKFGRGSVLVTSRDPFAKQNLYVEHGLNLPPLSSSESEAMMQRLTHVKADTANKEALSIIASKLDGLPLAIDQMSGVLRQLRLSYKDFLKYYEEEGIEGLIEQTDDNPVPRVPSVGNNGHAIRSLATVWALDRLSKGTKALLQVICLLDPDGIPEDLLIGKSASIKMLEDYPTSRWEYYKARSELVASSLINQDAEHESISLHRLIQETARAGMAHSELVAAYQAAGSLIISEWPFQSMKEHHSVARFAKCEALFPSVLRFMNGLQPIFHESPDLRLEIGIAKLFNDTGWYMFERGLMEETKPFCDFGLVIGERLRDELGEAAIESIRESHSFIGIVLAETNEHALSMAHKKKWLSMLEERRSPVGDKPVEDYELGYAYNEIGVAYGNNDMLEEAAQAFRRSIEIFQGLDDYEDTMLGWPEPNLGFIYWMQGEQKDAEEALLEILDIHAAAWGVDDTKSFKTGKILYGMGNVLEAQGRFEESFNFHQRCLKQFTKVLGPNHHRVGDIYHKMAGHYIREKQYKDAEDFLHSALKIFSARSYLTNERTRTTYKKAMLHLLMGNEESGNELLADAYSLWKSLRPRDTRPLKDLKEDDFDHLVGFWSR